MEHLHIISDETNKSIINKIENFNMVDFLKMLHFDYILSESMIDSAGELITGVTLKHILTAIMLYKIFTPLRYLLTLTVTKVLISIFKNKGFIPKQPPPGYSIKDIYAEKKLIYQKRLINQKQRYLLSKQNFKLGLERTRRNYFLRTKSK